MGIDASCRHISAGGYRCRINDWTSIDVFTRQLDLSGVAPGVPCLVLVDPTSHPDMGSIAAMAASRLGADAITVSSPVPLDPRRESALLSNLTTAGGVVVDLTEADAGATVLASGENTRVLVVGDLSPERLRRLHPHVGLSRRVDRAVERILHGSVLDVHSSDGSRLSIRLAGASVDGHRGVPTDTNPMARWPDGRVTLQPAAGSVEGAIVAMPRDVVVETQTYVSSPMTLSIHNDHVADVSGNSADTDLVRALLGAAEHRDGYGFAGVEIGLANEAAVRLGGHATGEYVDLDSPSRLAGVVTVAFGANPTADRTRAGRVSLVLHAHSVNVDGRPMVADGDLQGDLRPDVYESAG